MGLFTRDSGSGSAGDDADGDATGVFWQERGFIASAIVVGAVVVCLLVWFFARDTGTPTTQPTTSPTAVVPTEQPTDEPSVPPATPTDEPTSTSTPTPSGPPTPGSGGCKLKNPNQKIPRVAPTAVSWQFEADMLIPLQQEGGPAVMDRTGVRSCFAHSPTGAVLAAMVTLGQIRNPALTDDVLATRIAPGPGRNLAISEARVSRTPRNEGDVAQFTAFKVIDYTTDRAIVYIAVQLDDRKVAALPVTLTWLRGDWKVVLQEDGSFNGSVQPDLLQSLDGYVGFRGA
ncbi:hypothetical protein EV652_108157 [Kribbella steppae]|uniref:DUF8175 domain-containing protein n=1 Tax=Kribbella steppae TaxID=2512223 RepID=A0A4V2RZ77_9ACTN|nr:hypothetical protein [Kribbella steppae]TCO24625.1 hypothetical protein EV652_108157 [Kribbella steppae]